MASWIDLNCCNQLLNLQKRKIQVLQVIWYQKILVYFDTENWSASIRTIGP